jgi:enoyl-CoA hydratase
MGMTVTVTTTIDGDVAVVRMDDGKMNAVSHAVLEQLHAALDTAAAEARAVCLVGNDKALSAGFDLAVMTGDDPEAVRGLVHAGAELLMRLYVHPQPTVAAVTGHALAAGALLALVCDTRIAVPGRAKIGLNEVAIGLALPAFAIELAEARLANHALTRATIQAEVFDPEGALAVGYVDRLDADAVGAALEEARRLATMPRGAYAKTKVAMRRAATERVLAGLTADLAGLVVEKD